MQTQQFQQPEPPKKGNTFKEVVKELVRTKSFWIFIIVAVLGAIAIILPFLGILIALLTILGVTLQGVETVLAQREIEQKHILVLQEIEQARGEAAQQHKGAIQEIKQARNEANEQYKDAIQKIEKARDEARAENILLEAEKFATSLIEKDDSFNEAVELYPNFKQRAHRQLGYEMAVAIVDGFDHTKHAYLQSAGYTFEAPNFAIKLEPDEISYFTDHAIAYLTETALDSANLDPQGLLYLACMYGARHLYDEMMEVLHKASKISQITQVMKGEFRERPMIPILVSACNSDEMKLDKLRETLNLPQTTEQFFCDYITKEYPLNPNYPHGTFIKWVVVKKLDTLDVDDTTIINTSPVYPSDAGKAYAWYKHPNGRPEEVVPAGEKIPLEELYQKLSSLFILFCHID